MAVLIKRFRVRHNGETYGPGELGGQILEGLSEEEEAQLIQGSNGTIEKYEPPQPAKASEKQQKTKKKASTSSKSGQSKKKNEQEEQIADINPDELIKPAGKEDKKEGKKANK